MTRICLYYRTVPESDRWIPGDRYVRPSVRRLVRGEPRKGGVEKVFQNLRLGLDRMGVTYEVNPPFSSLRPKDRVGVLGRGRYSLEGYDRSNPVVAGIGLMTHPSEWPTLCDEYPIAFYLQHSEWANDVYKPYFGSRCRTWAAGIDTTAWRPSDANKAYDFLLYDKIRWNRETVVPGLLEPVQRSLEQRHLRFRTLRYGEYSEPQYRDLLAQCRAMIFLCEHESQGIAYLEALSSGVPVLAWDQGACLDPNRFPWGQPEIPATSVPFFDARCGGRFKDAAEFAGALDSFLDAMRDGRFSPRDYVLENLTVEKCSRRFLDLLEEAQT